MDTNDKDLIGRKHVKSDFLSKKPHIQLSAVSHWAVRGGLKFWTHPEKTNSLQITLLATSTAMAEVTLDQLDNPEGRDRRRTVVIYKSAAAEAPTGGSADGTVPKEKLASHKNLMYSEREAELIEDLVHFLIEKQPSYVTMQASTRAHQFVGASFWPLPPTEVALPLSYH